MKTKRSFILLPLMLALTAVTGCGNNDHVDRSPTTINIKAYKGGFGDTWLLRLKEKFEAAYSEEGYKINIVKTSSTYEGSTILSDMRVSGSGIDMYFVQNVSVDDVTNQDYGTCALAIDDVYESYPVKYDRTNENKKIIEKLDSQFTNVVKTKGSYYGYLWANTPCGLIVNTSVLQANGLSIPRTTDELFNCYSVISNTGMRPFTWGGYDAAGYALYALYPLIGQLLGKEAYTQFLNLQDGETAVENDYKNGYKKYENDDIYTAVSTMQRMYDTTTSIASSSTKSNSESHFNIMTGKCAFAVDGDFFYSEVKNTYGDKLNNIEFVNIPVISALGTKLQLDGSGTNVTKCDQILSSVIGMIDENKTNEEIKTSISTTYSVTLEDAKINRIKEARNTNYQKLCSVAYIQKDTEKADICKELLKFASSDDYGHTFNETNNTAYPYCSTNSFGNNKFAKGIEKVMSKTNALVTCNRTQGGLRKEAGVPMFPTYDDKIVLTLVSEKLSAPEIKNKMLTNITGRWPTLMEAIGHHIQ